MPGTSQTKAKNKYNAKAYDRVNLTVLKGKKGIINEIAEKKGKALNGYIKAAIQAQIKADTGENVEL